MSYWDSLDPKYRLILCDVWGVVHDGVNLADCCRPVLPEYVKNRKFQLRRTNRLCHCHGGAIMTKTLVKFH